MEKHLTSWLAFLLLILAGCGGSSENSDSGAPVSPASMFMERDYFFCSQEHKDRFLLGHFGMDKPETDIHFFIVTVSNDTIYRDQWPASELSMEGGAGDHEALHLAMEAFIEQAPQPALAGPTTGPGFAYQSGKIHRKIGFCKKSKSVIVL